MFKGLFRKRPLAPSNVAPMDNVIAWYGQTLEKHSWPIEDASVLPLPKQAIKDSILAKLTTSTDKNLRDELMRAYEQLSSYQPLTDAEKSVVKTYNDLAMENVSPTAMSPDSKKALVTAYAAIWPAYRLIQRRVEEECSSLTQELHQAGMR